MIDDPPECGGIDRPPRTAGVRASCANNADLVTTMSMASSRERSGRRSLPVRPGIALPSRLVHTRPRGRAQVFGRASSRDPVAFLGRRDLLRFQRTAPPPSWVGGGAEMRPTKTRPARFSPYVSRVGTRAELPQTLLSESQSTGNCARFPGFNGAAQGALNRAALLGALRQAIPPTATSPRHHSVCAYRGGRDEPDRGQVRRM